MFVSKALVTVRYHIYCFPLEILIGKSLFGKEGVSIRQDEVALQIVQHRLYCLTDQAGSITFDKRPFAKELESLQVRIRINRFLMEQGMGRYRIDLVSPWSLVALCCRYGGRQTRQYLKELKQSFPLGSELLRGCYAPLIRFGRRIKTRLS